MASNISVKQNQSCPRNIVKTVAGRGIINLLCLKKQHQYERDWDNEIIKKRKLGKVVKSNHMALNWKMRLQKHKESASIVSINSLAILRAKLRELLTAAKAAKMIFRIKCRNQNLERSDWIQNKLNCFETCFEIDK